MIWIDLNLSIQEDCLKKDIERAKRIIAGDKSFNKGGRVGYKSGTRGCKLAKRGKGRAYGKNS